MEANDPRGEVDLEFNGMVGRLNVGDYLTLLYILNIYDVGLMVSKKI